MPWNNLKLQSHLKSAKLLDEIKTQSFQFIKKNPATSEYKVQEFIRDKFKEKNLRLADHSPIVAFGPNTSHVHYFPKSGTKTFNLLARRSLDEGGKPETCILIDLWSRLNTHEVPFADITWMGFYGSKIPTEFQKIFDVVTNARDACLEYLKIQLKAKKMPTGAELDAVSRAIINKAGYGKNFSHSTGHSLGFISPHGKEAGISYKNNQPLEKNLGYTIEPGIYLENKFGARSEIDFYINSKNKIVITTQVQKKLVQIK
ncbi:MAG: aminopeptidase P family protein [Candidatus Liptonbacteria bacterium]|nr:aminopeptidase P family protein [Candidatus Liptonbacteria bacterium]